MNLKPDIREKTLKHGIGFPTDEELVMLILGTGTKHMPVETLARNIIRTMDDSNEEEVVKKLLRINGIGQGKALAVAAALELGKRRNCYRKALIRKPEDIIPYVKNYAVNTKEHFLMAILNGSGQIIKIHLISVGTLNCSLIHPREVFIEAIKENASSIILCHNHPSGDCTPSEEDVNATKVLLEASLIIGIEILDHIIIDCDSYYSFLEHDLLFSSDD